MVDTYGLTPIRITLYGRVNCGSRTVYGKAKFWYPEFHGGGNTKIWTC